MFGIIITISSVSISICIHILISCSSSSSNSSSSILDLQSYLMCFQSSTAVAHNVLSGVTAAVSEFVTQVDGKQVRMQGHAFNIPRHMSDDSVLMDHLKRTLTLTPSLPCSLSHSLPLFLSLPLSLSFAA